jgi:hypothetical protein
VTATTPATAPATAAWREAVAGYRPPLRAPSLWQLANTLVPYLALWDEGSGKLVGYDRLRALRHAGFRDLRDPGNTSSSGSPQPSDCGALPVTLAGKGNGLVTRIRPAASEGRKP